MPNYRNKNKNKNKNKNRNKNKNQNQNQDQNQNQKQANDQEKVSNEKEKQQAVDRVLNESTAQECPKESRRQEQIAEDAAVTVALPKSLSSTEREDRVESKAAEYVEPVAATQNATSLARNVNTTNSVFEIVSTEDFAITDESTDCNMGAKKSKLDPEATCQLEADITLNHNKTETSEKMVLEKDSIPSNSTPQGKVIIHRIVQESSGNDFQKTAAQPPEGPKVIIHHITQEEEKISEQSDIKNVTKDTSVKENIQENAKVIIHRIELEDNSTSDNETGKTVEYQVKSPELFETNSQSDTTSPTPYHQHQHHLQRDLQIQEISDEGSVDYNDNPPLISEASDSERENTDGVCSPTNSSVLSVQTFPLNTIVETTEEVGIASSQESDLKQRRAMKRAALESHFMPQLLSPRYLDSIMEENSDMSDARSDCSDNFVAGARLAEESGIGSSQQAEKTKKANAVFPRSNLDFSRRHKPGALPKTGGAMAGAIREETVALVVETKLIETEPAEESCSTLASAHTPISEAAEVVYINSSSSSLSDLVELDSENGDNDVDADVDSQSSSGIDLDTDAKEIIEKPSTVLRVESRESTPVNQTSTPATTNSAPKTSPPSTITMTESEMFRLIDRTMTTIATNLQEAANEISASPSTSATDQLKIICDHECGLAALSSSPLSALSSLSSGSETAQTTTTISSAEKYDDDSQSQSSTMTSSSTAEASESTATSRASNSLRAKHYAEPVPSTLIENIEMNNVREILNANIDHVVSAPRSTAISEEENVKRVETNELSNAPHVYAPASVPHPQQPHDTTSFLATHITRPHDHLTTTDPNINSSESSACSGEQQPPNLSVLIRPTPITSAVLSRQESADSHCSDSTTYSQCTAINVSASPQPDFDFVSSFTDDRSGRTPTEKSFASAPVDKVEETLASMPYGEQVLEELASVAQNIGELQSAKRSDSKMPYPLPDLPHINDLQLSIAQGKDQAAGTQTIAIRQSSNLTNLGRGDRLRSPTPPPVPAPPSSYDSWMAVPTEADPKLLVCLSPAQQSYLGDAQSADIKTDNLLDAHQKFLDRRGYHEYTDDQVRVLNAEKLEEQKILKTAAIMKQLRKSLTPPPIPPPPVPQKSSETAAKAQQNKTKTTATATATATMTTTVPAVSDNDASSRNANEQAKAVEPFGDGEEQHRLLAIINDDTSVLKQNQMPKTSSFENNSRQSSSKQGEPLQSTQTSNAGRPSDRDGQSEKLAEQTNARSAIHPPEQTRSAVESEHYATRYFPTITGDGTINMQSVESELAKMFPTLGEKNIFESSQKRFSNIESSSNSGPYCSQILHSQPKRFSNIETRSYEAQKRTENGQVVYDYSNSSHEQKSDGDRSSFPSLQFLKFPTKDCSSAAPCGPFRESEMKSDDREIMSALKLKADTTTTNAAPPQAPPRSEEHLKAAALAAAAAAGQRRDAEEISGENMSNINRQLGSTQISKEHSAYEEFRQRAKAAAEATSASDSVSATTPATAPAHIGNNNGKSTFHFDNEKLFKDFDELSQQLHIELESGKARKEQREKSSSMFDLSRMQFKDQFEELKKHRHDHMKELEQQIEKSMRSRQLRSFVNQGAATPPSMASTPRTFDIPIKIENGSASELSEPVPRVFEIPVQIENTQYKVTTPGTPQTAPVQQPLGSDFVDFSDSRFRRAESMFNLSDTRPRRDRTYTQNYDDRQQERDDWTRYASDLGYSENIARPFAKEVEICYNRLRPNAIRAPRLSASTNDLSSTNTGTFDSYNAYGARRTHAPMLNQASHRSRPQYLSCHSMIERDPNPTYISTTSRRGVSPAPQPQSSQTVPQVPLRPAEYMEQYERSQRRASLPKEIHEQQLKYITSKEEELKTEFDRLQNERRRLMDEMQRVQYTAPQMPPMRPMRDLYRPMPKLPTLSEDEVFRQQMAEEWLNKVAEREERRLQKIIKISKINDNNEGRQIPITHGPPSKSDISEEFLSRVKERRSKLAMPSDSDWESGAESHPVTQGHASETDEDPSVKVIEGKSETNLRQLPRHLREFAKFSNHERDEIEGGGQREVHQEEERRQEATDNSLSTAFKKSSVVKTVRISSQPTLANNSAVLRKTAPSASSNMDAGRTGIGSVSSGESVNQKLLYKKETHSLQHESFAKHHTIGVSHKLPPRHVSGEEKKTSSQLGKKTIDNIGRPIESSGVVKRKQTRFSIAPDRRSCSESDLLKEIDNGIKLAKDYLFTNVYKVKHEYMSEPETENDRPRKMAQLGRRQYDGIGPVTNDGMPIILRSEVKEPHQHEWYKRLYQTIHKQKSGDDYVIRYKCPRARPQYKTGGYQSEPEPNYDSDYSTVKYRTLDRRRLQSCSSAANVRSGANFYPDDKLYGTLPQPVKPGQSPYKNQPGRIENYITGHSSVSEKAKKEWWDEVMDIFNGHLEQTKLSPHYTEGNLSRALTKDSGYTSDSNLVFRKKEVPQGSPLSPIEQKQAYKQLQAGGDPPLLGFQKAAPEKHKESPNRYFESDVNIHFKTPVRHEFKSSLTEEELAVRQAEQMQKLYQEERRRKYLQELQDMSSRRHTDNFIPSQKSPIPLNRYDDFPSDLAPKSPNSAPKAIARALYNFQGQNARELTFKKGDIIYIRRQIDKNWYEGEHNAMIGLLPVNYIEIVNKDGPRPQPKKPSEGQARAKYNFQAQSGVELSLNKGELVTLTRRVDDNWFEGKIANRKGIFPVSYVEVLTDIGAEDKAAKTVITEQSVTSLRPSLEALRTNINNEFNMLTRNGHQPPNGILKETRNLHKTDVLHVDTSSEPLTYRALYKYRPQNSDEMELLEGDIVHVLEICDDGWFVGTSQRTGCFGTFPGNYVERV